MNIETTFETASAAINYRRKMNSRKKRILLKDYKPGGSVLMNWKNILIKKY
jgi:hypothetical protein